MAFLAEVVRTRSGLILTPDKGFLVESRLASPRKSPRARTIRLPSISSVSPATSPVRILGPWMSCNMATLRPRSCAAPRTTSAFFKCVLWSPWEKLNLVTSTPARTRAPMASSVEVAGPSVATILVLRAIRRSARGAPAG